MALQNHKLRCIDKVKDKSNKIIAYKMLDENGSKLTLTRRQVQSILLNDEKRILNLKITSNGRIIETKGGTFSNLCKTIRGYIATAANDIDKKHKTTTIPNIVENKTNRKTYTIHNIDTSYPVIVTISRDKEECEVICEYTKFSKTFKLNIKQDIQEDKLREIYNLIYNLVLKTVNQVKDRRTN